MSMTIKGFGQNGNGFPRTGQIKIQSGESTAPPNWTLAPTVENIAPVTSSVTAANIPIVSQNDNVIVFGGSTEPADDVPANTGAGALYVYTKSGSTYLSERIQPTGLAQFSQFGAAATISPDEQRIAVARPFGSGATTTSIYVYLRSGNTWILEDEASHPATGYNRVHFVDNDTIMIGTATLGAFFSRSGSTWSTTTNPNSWPVGNYYNMQRTDDSVTLVSGFSGDDAGLPDSGRVYSDVLVTGNYVRQTIASPNYGERRYFGDAIAMSADGTRMLAQQRHDNFFTSDLDSTVYYYERSGNNWVYSGIGWQAFGLSEKSGFGGRLSVDASGTYLFVGNTLTTESFIYAYNGSTWALEKTFASGDFTSHSAQHMSRDGHKLFYGGANMSLNIMTAGVI